MKNLIKSIYISMYMMGLFAVAAFSITLMNLEELIWYPIFIIALVPLLFFAFLFLRKPSKTKLPRFIVWGLSLISFSNILVLNSISEEPKSMAIILAGVMILLWVIYDLWYSKFDWKGINEPIKQNSMNGLVFKDSYNKTFKPEEHLGTYNIYLFHRGNWCPLCMAQIRDVSNSYNELEKLGAKIFLISPATDNMTASLAKKHNVNLHFLRDENLAMADKLHIRQEFGVPLGMQVFGFSSHTIFPTIVITDATNNIIHQSQSDDYRNRPEPDAFIKIIEEASVK